MDMNPHPVLIYDGQCPFCANYVRLLRLRESFPRLELINARADPDHPAIQQLKDRGLQIDDGMALVDGDSIYHGSESIHALADKGTDRTVFGRLNRVIFRSSRASAALYPVLRTGRNLTLRVLGRRKLGF